MGPNMAIWGNALSAPKSPLEYANVFQQQADNALASEMNRQKIDAYKAAEAERPVLVNLLSQSGFDPTSPQGVAAAYKAAPRTAADFLKGFYDNQEALAKAAKEKASTSEIGAKTVAEAMKNSRFSLEGVTTPEQYMAWHEANHKDPILGPYLASRGVTADQARARIADMLQKPGGFEQLLSESKLGAEKAYEQALKQQEFGLKANNELIGPDGKVNLPLLGAKQKVAKAGASNTNVNVNTDKTLTSTMAKGLGDQLDASLAGAQAATNTIGTAKQIRDLVSSGKVITGPGADYRVTLARIGDLLGVSGADNQEKLSNTAALVQNLAKTELDSAQSMKGQGQITEAERAILKKAAGGDLNMSAPELISLSNAMDKTARARISSHQSKVDKLRSVPGAEPLIPFYSVDTPGAPKAGAIEDGHRFKGGNPADPNNWEKVK